jgi:regulatory protein
MLARRPLSEGEVRSRLARKGHVAADVEAAVSRLRELGLLDDDALCRQLVRTYQEGRGYGPAKTAWKLAARGFPRDLVAAAVREGCSAEAVAEAAATALRRKFRGGIPPGRDGTAKAYRFLAGRGFPPGACRDAIGRRLSETSEGDD